MDCAEEVSILRARLSRLKGVRDLRFDVLEARMEVEYVPERVSPAQIEGAVAGLGMTAEPWREEAAARRDRAAWLTWAAGLLLAAGLTVEAFLTGDWFQALFVHEHGGEHAMPAAAFLFFAGTIIAGAVPLLPRAWGALLARRPDMNLLVVVSISGAAALSEWTEAATLAFLFSLAGRLESWSLAKARGAIASLLEVTPAEASVLHAGTEHGREDRGEHEHRVPVARVQPGAVVRVRPGERIPFDGEVVRGRSWVNQALLTGESVAVERAPGDAVLAGSLNEDGVLDIRTTRPASDTTLARLIRMVRESQARRAPSEQFVERLARYYTPAILLLAFSIAFVPALFDHDWNHWLYQGMVILLIACPCALVISTPVTIVSAIASAARKGLLIKGGAFLEEAARVRALALAKNGVLTAGKPELREFLPMAGANPDESLAVLARLESSSGHPLARAVVAAARARGIHPEPLPEFAHREGLGAEASGYWAGNVRFLRERGMACPETLRRMEELASQGDIVLAFGDKNGVSALATFSEMVRPEAAGAVESLRGRGIDRIVLLTGDNARTARAVAKQTGIWEVEAELTPEEKAGRVSEMLRETRHVAMIGDGAGDLSALSVASLGICLSGAGTDGPAEAADVIVMGGGLRRIVFLVDHARRAIRVVKQNVGIAMVTKALFLAAAVTGNATLWMAVAADMGATFAVTLNGLRLLRAKDDGASR